MSITLLDGGTSSTTGGSNQEFDRTSETVNNGYAYADVAEADFFARDKIILASRMPAVQADGLYSKQKTSVKYVSPVTRTDGSIGYNVTRVETELYPESSAAQLTKHREYAAQAALDSELDDLFVAGTFPA